MVFNIKLCHHQQKGNKYISRSKIQDYYDDYDDTSAKFYVLRTTEGNIRISTTRLVYDTLISGDMIQECLNHKKTKKKWNHVTYSQYQLAFHINFSSVIIATVACKS